MPDERQGGGAPQEVGQAAAGAVIDTNRKIMKHAADEMLQSAPKLTRFVLRHVPDGPGFLYDTLQLATSPDKIRTGVGMAGSALGGALGFAVGGPVGSVAGSGVGDALATEGYDHRDDIVRALEATKQWIAQRNADLFGR
jgi:hypothetical protein